MGRVFPQRGRVPHLTKQIDFRNPGKGFILKFFKWENPGEEKKGEGFSNYYTGCNEVVAKVMFLLVSVILSTGGCYPSMHCRWSPGVVSQHALQVIFQHALQQVSQGVPALGGLLLWGGLLLGGSAPRGCGLLLWPSVMAFWCGLLVWCLLIEGSLLVESGLPLWPSGMTFWYGLLVRPSGTGVSPNRDPFNQKGITEGYQNGLLVCLLLWPSGVIFCYGLLVWPSGHAMHAPPKQTATVADGTHPTGIHSCCR